MVQPLSKLANPWKCDAPGCGQLRANDTNHWLILSTHRDPEHRPEPLPYVVISPWDDKNAAEPGVKHACGIDCTLRIAAMLVVKHFSPAEIPLPGKEVANGN